MDDSFGGEFDYSVDEKGRMLVPTEYRTLLAGIEIVMLARGDDGQIDIYPKPAYDIVLKKLATSDSARFRRKARFLRAANACTIDKQWRIGLPTGVREHAAIANKATIVGNGDHFEVWHPELWKRFWDSFVEQNALQPDDLTAVPTADEP